MGQYYNWNRGYGYSPYSMSYGYNRYNSYNNYNGYNNYNSYNRYNMYNRNFWGQRRYVREADAQYYNWNRGYGYSPYSMSYGYSGYPYNRITTTTLITATSTTTPSMDTTVIRAILQMENSRTHCNSYRNFSYLIL